MDTMNLTMAILAHLNWKSRLTDFFYGLEELSPADVPSHVSCDFGRLLNSGALMEFDGIADLDKVRALHKEVHDEINKLVAMPKDRRMSDEGKQALAAFKARCDSFVSMLEETERQAKRKK